MCRSRCARPRVPPPAPRSRAAHAPAPPTPARRGRRAACEPGPRTGPRRFTFGAVCGDRRRRQLRALDLLLPEHLLLALALEQRQELLLLERLAPDEDLGDLGEVLLMFGEDLLRALVSGLDDAPHLLVDLARDLVGVVGLGG